MTHEATAGAPTGSVRGRPRVALVVNPVAGLGGAVGLKGSDGPEIVRQALALGAVPHAEERAAATVQPAARLLAARCRRARDRGRPGADG